ncbi:MAG: hypothetical protein WCO84_08640 [bacterium]
MIDINRWTYKPIIGSSRADSECVLCGEIFVNKNTEACYDSSLDMTFCQNCWDNQTHRCMVCDNYGGGISSDWDD